MRRFSVCAHAHVHTHIHGYVYVDFAGETRENGRSNIQRNNGWEFSRIDEIPISSKNHRP